MEALPKRSDDLYIEVEKFKDYEYTNCIAYEMAIRNVDIKKLLVTYIILPILFSKDERNEPISHPLKDLLGQKLEEKYLIDYYGIKYLEEGLEKELNNQNAKLVSKLYEDIIYCYNEESHLELVNNYGYNNIKEMKKESIKEIENLILCLPFFKRKERKFDNLFKMPISIRYETSNGLKFNSWFEDEKNKKSNSNLFDVLSIENKLPLDVSPEHIFSRPELRKTKEFKINMPEINLSLPLEDIIAYIKKVKKELEYYEVLKTPLEILDKDLQKSDKKKPTKKTIADKFYIYDCYKLLKYKNPKETDPIIYSIIDNHLLEHYNSLKENYYSEKTYKNIKKEMFGVIDNLGYKDLITGISNKR